MDDLFRDKADDYDSRPVPMQISQGVWAAMAESVAFEADHTVLDFGAGTGLVTARVAGLVAKVIAVDISAAMLAKLQEKTSLRGKVETVCQDITREPLDQTVDVVVSAMAAHHVEDTALVLSTLFAHLRPGGQLALADLDAEDGSFHPAGIEGVFHAGFARQDLAALAVAAGFETPVFRTACEVDRGGVRYPIFLMTARRPT